jgi:hypothetical protein
MPCDAGECERRNLGEFHGDLPGYVDRGRAAKFNGNQIFPLLGTTGSATGGLIPAAAAPSLAGIALYSGHDVLPFEDRLLAAPITALWEL